MRASGDGFAWPDLLIVPDGGETRLVWGSDGGHSSNWPVRFLTRGDLRLKSDQVQQELELLITETLTRLSEQGVSGTVLEGEWAAIQNTDPEEAEYCEAAARLGLDPYSDAEPYEQDIVSAAETLSGPLQEDFLNAVSPDHIRRALAWMSSVPLAGEEHWAGLRPVASQETATLDADVIQDLRHLARRSFTDSSTPPWSVGYQQAQAVRRRLVPDSTVRFDVDRNVVARTRKAPDLSLQALGAGANDPRTTVIIGQARPAASTRFTLTRALWHRIWDDSPIFVVTSAHTHRQQIERALEQQAFGRDVE